jgi:hypothetical protein
VLSYKSTTLSYSTQDTHSKYWRSFYPNPAFNMLYPIPKDNKYSVVQLAIQLNE